MKRLQIMIEEDLDDALGAQAIRERTSKAALIRRYVRDRMEPLPPIEEDPLWDLAELGEGGPDWSVSIDEELYGPLRSG
jgi:hypothetical protein